MVNLNEFQFYFLERERMLLLAWQEVYGGGKKKVPPKKKNPKKTNKACEALRCWGEGISVGRDLQPSFSPADPPVQG